MLTNDDLQQIRIIVKEEVQTEVMKEVRREVGKEIRKETTSMKKDIQSIKEDINHIISLFDREYVGLTRRVDRIEKFIKIPSLEK